MDISFSPIRSDDVLAASVAGDILTVNGMPFDFSAVTEGATLDRMSVGCDWLASDVTRTGGMIELTLLLPHAANADGAQLFPSSVAAADGAVALP